MTEREPFDELLDLTDAVLGSVEELDSDELDRSTVELDDEMDSLKRNLYEVASRLRGHYWSRNSDVPGHLADFLQQVRPLDLPSSDPTVEAAAVRKWIDNLLRRRPDAGDAEVAMAFRDQKGDLSADDTALLKDLSARLKKKLEDGEP